MKKDCFKGIGILVLFFGFQVVYGQGTPEQIRQVIKEYDTIGLQQKATGHLHRQTMGKAAAEAYARAHNIPVRIEGEEGVVSELMEILPGGRLLYYSTFNVDAAKSTRADHLHSGGSLGLHLNGQGMVAYVWDGGHARVSHQEYDGSGGDNRVSFGDASEPVLSSHATHVVGTIVASGVDPLAKGMAPQAQAKSYDWTSDLAEATAAVLQGMLVSNHSYGVPCSSSVAWENGGYIDRSYDWDELLYNAPYYLSVWAAGNEGVETSCNTSPLNPDYPLYDKLTGARVSKNTLVVASAQDADVAADGNLQSVYISSFSSQGPTDDLRIKPDITGNGQGVYSTYDEHDAHYASISGTSMASPNVSGSLLLLQQHAYNLNGSYIKAATLKGLALHTSDDAGMEGPDARFGWGLLNVKRAAETLSGNGDFSLVQELTLNQGQTHALQVYSDDLNPLMASISWTDPASADIATGPGDLNDMTPKLVNDLDIRVTKNEDEFFPWRLTGVNTNGKGDNFRDPFERVDIENATGSYTITVTHKGTLSGGSQNFTLIVTGITHETCRIAGLQKNTSINNASFTWETPQEVPQGYQWALMASGSDPDQDIPLQSGTLGSNAVSLLLNNLNALTGYDFYIRAECEPGQWSSWQGVPFITSAAFPFLEDFEDSSQTRSYWTQVVESKINSDTDYSWTFGDGTGHGGMGFPHNAYEGSRNARFVSVGKVLVWDADINNWKEVTNDPRTKLVTPPIDLSHLSEAELRFYHAQKQWDGDQNRLKVYTRKSPGDNWQLLAEFTNDTPAWTEAAFVLTDLSPSYQVAFEGINNYGYSNVLDEVSIRPLGYVYDSGVWTPSDPSGVATGNDNITVISGSVTLGANTECKHLSVLPGAVLYIDNVLKVEGNIRVGGDLVFRSSATGTGQLDEMASSSVIEGSVTVERYIPARRAFRFLSSAVTTSGSIRNNWQEGVNNPDTSTNLNPRPGYGTHITGSSSGANGFDATISGNPSLFVFNNQTQSWEASNNTNQQQLIAGYPYRLMVRGDRGVNLNSNETVPTPSILTSKGTLSKGTIIFEDMSSGSGDFNFIGNPYQSVVNMNAVVSASTNINGNYYYVWDPTLGGEPVPGQPGGRGAYVTIDLSDGTNPSGSQANEYLQPGQAAFVTTGMNGSAAVLFQESHKAVNQPMNQVFNSATKLDIRLYHAGAYVSGSTACDGLRIKFDEDGDNDVTSKDAPKLLNQDEVLAIEKGEIRLGIESRNFPVSGEIYPLSITQYRASEYVLQFYTGVIDPDLDFILEDQYAQIEMLIPQGETITYGFTRHEGDEGSSSPNRFRLKVAESTHLTYQSTDAYTISIYPNPSSGEVWVKASQLKDSTPRVTLFNLLGQTVHSETIIMDELGVGFLDVSKLSSGLYRMRVEEGTHGSVEISLIKK